MRNVKDSIDEAVPDVTEVTEEIKSAKSSLQDSIYKSVEANFKGKEGIKEEAKEKEVVQTNSDLSKAEGEGADAKKEADKNG